MTDLIKQFQNCSPEELRRYARLVMPRLAPGVYIQTPFPKQQSFMVESMNPNSELLYGGQVAGGKSSVALMCASMYWDVPGYSCVIFRRTYKDLIQPGAILDRAREWWRNDPNVIYHPQDYEFEYKGGGRIKFAYMAHDNDLDSHQGANYQCVIWDELTQFKENWYGYLFSRLRKPMVPCMNCDKSLKFANGGFVHEVDSVCEPKPSAQVLKNYPPAKDGTTLFDVPIRSLATSNPGGRGHLWVRDKFIDPVLKKPGAKFMAAAIDDNPAVNKTEYLKTLENLDPVTYRQLVNGDWFATPEGEMFKSHWFEVVDEAPVGGVTVRFWDMAATKGDGDHTVGVLVRLVDGVFFVLDMVRGQWDSGEKEKVILQTAMLDGREVEVGFEQEPGSAGVDVVAHYRKLLAGFAVWCVRPTGSKVERAKIHSAAAYAGNMKLVKGGWNRVWLDEHLLFPQQVTDKSSSPDIVDATSGAVKQVSRRGPGGVLLDSRDVKDDSGSGWGFSGFVGF